ncbi:alpha/beta hydrolase [Gemmata sp.]|uniref:alpha/beta hydrolase n=1 Tax=Gemmata sp. TaxID=1914242 RepID=UPI003F70C628
MEQPASPRRSWPRRIGRFVLRWTVFYLGIVLVMWLLERKLAFHPLAAADGWEPPVAAGTRDVSFPSADGTTINAWWLPGPTPSAGALLLANGNGGNLSYRGELADRLHRTLGCGVLLFDYPGYGKNLGSPSEEGCYAAGEAAFQWLTTDAQVPANRVILMGESLGGGTAVELATRHDHRALVLLYTFTSLPAAAKHHYPFLPTHTIMRTRFDNLAKLPRCTRPIFIAHGTADTVVPFSHSETLYAAAQPPKELFWVEGADHESAVGMLMADPLAKFLAANAP